jgi:hypothetical protein
VVLSNAAVYTSAVQLFMLLNDDLTILLHVDQ